jgi:hypothetical protein
MVEDDWLHFEEEFASKTLRTQPEPGRLSSKRYSATVRTNPPKPDEASMLLVAPLTVE